MVVVRRHIAVDQEHLGRVTPAAQVGLLLAVVVVVLVRRVAQGSRLPVGMEELVQLLQSVEQALITQVVAVAAVAIQAA